ncbi:MAG: hypothetical protein R3190_10250 [Thermoanaerobaculia bacterium]|nr:hypothetical protein [Thermoanaerobaculia bacterium]
MRLGTTRVWLGVPLALIAADLAVDAPRAAFLVVDVDGDGVALSDEHYAVAYDVDGDGVGERVQWTVAGQRDGFLFLDRDGDGLPAPGEMLRTFEPPRGPSATGCACLAALDRPEAGGNGDGRVDGEDAAAAGLFIWIDEDHDAVPSRSEVTALRDRAAASISLAATKGLRVDGALNLHTAWAPLETAPRRRQARRSGDRRRGWVYEVRLPYRDGGRRRASGP